MDLRCKEFAKYIVLAGFGRVGHRIGEILTRAGLTFVALDSNPRIVKIERAKGYPVFNGDVCQPGLLKGVGAKGAKVIVVTLSILMQVNSLE